MTDDTDATRQLHPAWEDSLSRQPSTADATWTLQQDVTGRTIPLGEVLGQSDAAPMPTSGTPTAKQPYVITGSLGSGGFGDVLLAVQPELNREVAVKVLHDEYAVDPHRQRRFADEASITAGLEHPGIIPVHTAGNDYLMMKRVRGRTMRHHLRSGDMSLEQLIATLITISEAIGFAHARGIIHRDLKPANIMIGPFGEALLMDWGLASAHGEGDSRAPRVTDPQGACAGTPAYLAPECATGRHDAIGPATDIFGIGAILYEVLSGRPPYQGRTIRAVIHRAAACAYPILTPGPERPADLVAIAHQCLQAEPSDRGSLQGLRADLQRWLHRQALRREADSLATTAVETIGTTSLDHTAIATSLQQIDRARGLGMDDPTIDQRHRQVIDRAVQWLLQRGDVNLADSIAAERPDDTGLQQRVSHERSERQRQDRLAHRRRIIIRGAGVIIALLLLIGWGFWWAERSAEQQRRIHTAAELVQQANQTTDAVQAMALLSQARGLDPTAAAVQQVAQSTAVTLVHHALDQADLPAAQTWLALLDSQVPAYPDLARLRTAVTDLAQEPARERARRQHLISELINGPALDQAAIATHLGTLGSWLGSSADQETTQVTHRLFTQLVTAPHTRPDLQVLGIRLLAPVTDAPMIDQTLITALTNASTTRDVRREAATALIGRRPSGQLITILDSLRADKDIAPLARQLLHWERDTGVLSSAWQPFDSLTTEELTDDQRTRLTVLADQLYAVGRLDEFLAASRLLDNTSVQHLRRRIASILPLVSQPARDHRRDYARQLLEHGPDPVAYAALITYELTTGSKEEGLRLAEEGIIACGEDHHNILPSWFHALTWTRDNNRLRAGFKRLIDAAIGGRITEPEQLREALVTISRYGAADRVADTAIAYATAHPDDLDIQLVHLEVLVEAKRWQEAIVLSHQISDRWPNRPHTYIHRSKAWLGRDDPERAHIAIQLGLARQPRLGYVLIQHGHVLRALNRSEQALARFVKAEEMLPVNGEAIVPGIWTAGATSYDGDALYLIERYQKHHGLSPILLDHTLGLHLSARRIDEALTTLERFPATPHPARQQAVWDLYWCLTQAETATETPPPPLPANWRTAMTQRTRSQIIQHLTSHPLARPATAIHLLRQLPIEDPWHAFLMALAARDIPRAQTALTALLATTADKPTWLTELQSALAETTPAAVLPPLRDHRGCWLPILPAISLSKLQADRLSAWCTTAEIDPGITWPQPAATATQAEPTPPRRIDADWQWPPTPLAMWLSKR